MLYGGVPHGGALVGPGGGGGGGLALLATPLLKLVTAFVPPQIADMPAGRPLAIRLVIMDADSGAAVDPPTLSLALTLDAVPQATYTFITAPGSPITRENVGVYRIDFAAMQPAGRWQGVWTCPGGEQSFEFNVFTVV